MRARCLALLLMAPLLLAAAPSSSRYASVPGGSFKSVLDYEDSKGNVTLESYALMRRPVTNAEFLEFVRKNPSWQRGKVPVVFAESRYLQSWAGPLQLGEKARPQQPVIDVSWFAADAYCQSIDARLPTWSEWEYAAAADETRKDARADPAWRERILTWYSRRHGAAPA